MRNSQLLTAHGKRANVPAKALILNRAFYARESAANAATLVTGT